MTTITSPTHTGTLKPKGWPPRFYWIQQEKEACGSHLDCTKHTGSSEGSSSHSPSHTVSSDTSTAAADPLRWGCRVVQSNDELWNVESGDGLYWLGVRGWVPYHAGTNRDMGIYMDELHALSLLNHPDTPPPPGWKAEQPASPGLRAAGEVARSIRNEMYTNTTNPYMKDGVERIVTDVRVAVASHIKTKLLEQFGMPDTRDRICDIMSEIFSELKGQA